MQYNPNDLKEMPPIKEGRYVFKVANAEEQTSKSGNPMIKLDMCVKISDYKSLPIFDYLVSTEKALFKIKQFCQSVGLPFNGDLNVDDVLGKTGEALFMHETGSDGRKYLKVAKYISIDEPPAQTETAEQTQSAIGDDIPF
jgi:hypothetical protein